MDHLPLVRQAWVHIRQDAGRGAPVTRIIHSGTLGEMLRWLRQQPVDERDKFSVSIHHSPGFRTYRELEKIAARTGSIG